MQVVLLYVFRKNLVFSFGRKKGMKIKLAWIRAKLLSWKEIEKKLLFLKFSVFIVRVAANAQYVKLNQKKRHVPWLYLYKISTKLAIIRFSLVRYTICINSYAALQMYYDYCRRLIFPKFVQCPMAISNNRYLLKLM